MLESISIPVNTPICAFPNSNIAPNDGVKARVSCLVLVLPLVEKLSRLTLETPIPNKPLKLTGAKSLLVYRTPNVEPIVKSLEKSKGPNRNLIGVITLPRVKAYFCVLDGMAL